MSSGSTFYIVSQRLKHESFVEKEAFEELKSKYRDWHDNIVVPLWMHNEDHSLVSRETREIFPIVSEDMFTSSFTVLKDYWYLSPNDNLKCNKEISLQEAKDIEQACKYVLGRRWCTYTEDLLKNPFIDAFRDEGYFMKKDDLSGEDRYMIDDLHRLKSVMSTFIHLLLSDCCDFYRDDRSDFKLIYEAW